MKNKINIFFLLFIFTYLFIGIVNVNAETEVTTSCEYSDLGLTVVYDEGGTATITQTEYENSSFMVPVLGWFYTGSSGSIEYVNELKHIETELYGSCPKNIYACTYEKWIVLDLGGNVIIDDFVPEGTFLEKAPAGIGVGTDDSALFFTQHKKLYLFYSENNMKDNATLATLPNNEYKIGTEIIDNYADYMQAWDNICGGVCAWTLGLFGGTGVTILDIIGIDMTGDGGGIDVIYGEYKNCNYVNYIGENPTFNLACPKVNTYLKRFNEALNEYKKCDKQDAACVSKAITNVNEKEVLIKNYCKSILKEQEYDGGDEQLCIESCLDNVHEIIKAKRKAGLLSENSGDCGFSERLGVWILNIFRWVKYILPVVVIVLGILDFIKAIASNKEDEMKKAQKSFIIRLIAAALVFIVPLILEFVLIKIGLGYESCGLF